MIGNARSMKKMLLMNIERLYRVPKKSRDGWILPQVKYLKKK